MDNIYSNEDVKELIKNDFDITKNNAKLQKKITQGLNGILVIYAPWCETCLMTKQMWENLASLFKYKFNIYALNAYNFEDDNQFLMLPLNVSVYPEYKFIKKNGDILPYKGKKIESEITKFIIKNID